MRPLALILVLLLGAPALRAAEEAEEKKRGVPTYESPLLSLLFLPVNVLIKMASVLAPEERAETSGDSSSK